VHGGVIVIEPWIATVARQPPIKSGTNEIFAALLGLGLKNEQFIRAIATASFTKTTVLPNVQIIPIVIGIYGYTYGSVLGIFLAGMLIKTRGSNSGNIIAMIIGFIVAAILSGLPNNIVGLFAAKLYTQPSWLPLMRFPWWIFFGTVVTFCVAILFRTKREHLPSVA